MSRTAINKITHTWLSDVIACLDKENPDGTKCNAVYWHKVAETEMGTGLYIVVGWGDGFDEAPKHTKYADGTYRICAKIGYASGTAGITGYEDFYMPYDLESGDVCDTDSEVKPYKYVTDRLNREAREVWHDYKDTLDKLG
jgi:hypothetical protein